MRNIVLIGMRGSGKSTLGKSLATKLNMDFIDTDEIVKAKAGTDITTIVESRGWDHFRQLEKSAISEATDKSNQVIATGGGAILDSMNVINLRDAGTVIYLKCDPIILAQRIRESEDRPTLLDTSIEIDDEVEQLYAERKKLYEEASDFEFDVSSSDLDKLSKSLYDLCQNLF